MTPIKKCGRPKRVINWDIVDEYLQAHCSGASIASFLGVHKNTLYLSCKAVNKCNFSEYSAQKKHEGQDLLRKTQFDLAMKGNQVLLIWLGKQYLGQKEPDKYVKEESASNDEKIQNALTILKGSVRKRETNSEEEGAGDYE